MTDLPSIRKYVTLEEVWAFAAGSVSLSQSLGEVINWIQDNMSLTPIGSVIESFLTEAQFQAQMGVGWVLLDGRNVSGSAYHTLTGNTTIPNARGRFLRGKKNSRGDGKGEPSELALGTTQDDENTLHNHDLTIDNQVAKWSGFYDVDHDDYGQPRYLSSTDPDASIGIVKDGLGSAEMRPILTVSNFFIRIN